MRTNPISRHVKNKGEAVYRISPFKRGESGAPVLSERRESGLYHEFLSVREKTKNLFSSLSVEDYLALSEEGNATLKCHLSYMSWIFENTILKKFYVNYKPFNADFDRIFKDKQGFKWFSRPLFGEVEQYRKYVDNHVEELLYRLPEEIRGALEPLALFAIHSEAALQESMLSDLKAAFFQNPLYPTYEPAKFIESRDKGRVWKTKWVSFNPGIYNIGHGGAFFAFEDESPRHTTFIHPFALSKYLVTNGEFLSFILDGGYEREDLWLHEGWQKIQKNGQEAPLYWFMRDGKWFLYTLSGVRELDLIDPVSHVNYYEADAYARWAGLRLPTELEWEVAAESHSMRESNFLQNGLFHPSSIFSYDSKEDNQLTGLFGDVWEWTSSIYAPYPGFPFKRDNRDFRALQRILRGGSAFFDQTYFRKTYRKHASPCQATLLSGIRLATDDL